MWRHSFCFAPALLLCMITSTSCVQNLPELNPMKYASPDPGEEWQPPPNHLPSVQTSDRLPTIPPDLKPSAEKLSLSQFVDAALRQNPATRQAWEQARAAAAAWAVARGSYYPDLSGVLSVEEAKGGQNEGSSSFTETIGTASVALTYLLLDFGGRSAGVEAAKQALYNANWTHNQAIQDVLRNVAQAYYTLIGNKAQLQADLASLKDAETSLQAAELRLQVGLGTVVDVLQAKSTVAQVQLDIATDRGAIEISRGELATAVGWPANTAFDVEDEPKEFPLDSVSENVEELIAEAQQNRPNLAAARSVVLQKEAEVRQAESAQWPQLVASALLEPEVVRGGVDDNSLSYQFLVGLQFPIFQGFSLINQVRQARASLEAAQAALLIQEERVISEVWNAYYNFRTAVQQLEASEVLLESATKSYEASLARYRSGVGDIVELLNAQSTLTEARAERVQARTSLHRSYAELIHAIGKELPVASSINDSFNKKIDAKEKYQHDEN